ncbi:hypothetical protein SODALDRAFT_377775 [Sodiomyces alkalinus F11]|uniref:Uncharacterized protein n=1 Tax=Sodiomyces alkalinus (strain CBS 110278 / VKM F-3762 / F11) TaxID=1314773 RepID=A0A3N2PZF0_SODAK|nr:hypothetical protein SODALDRAFT_377775 [Sodiomyces alkalinus F11]ROT39862.1 hypothetical protein SODALDRAFT_377775 [Sodiomyces alkalinus F11]
MAYAVMLLKEHVLDEHCCVETIQHHRIETALLRCWMALGSRIKETRARSGDSTETLSTFEPIPNRSRTALSKFERDLPICFKQGKTKEAVQKCGVTTPSLLLITTSPGIPVHNESCGGEEKGAANLPVPPLPSLTRNYGSEPEWTSYEVQLSGSENDVRWRSFGGGSKTCSVCGLRSAR